MLAVSTAAAAPPQAIPLLAATLANDIAAVHHRLDAGDDPNLADGARNTALIYAARDGRTEIARLLLARGADPGWIDSEGVTPLILAAFKNHVVIARLLLARDVDRNHRDQWGRRAIDYARRRGPEDEILRLLAE